MLWVEVMNDSDAQPLERLLEVRDVGRAQVDEGVGLAGHRVRTDDLGVPAHRRGDLAGSRSTRCRTAPRTPRSSTRRRPDRSRP